MNPSFSEEERPQFDIQQLLPIGMTLIVLTIGIAYGLSVLSDVRDDSCDYTTYNGQCVRCATANYAFNSSAGNCYNTSNPANTNAYTNAAEAEFNATADGITAIAKIPEKLSLIVTIIIAAVIIGILIRYLWMKQM